MEETREMNGAIEEEINEAYGQPIYHAEEGEE